MRPSQRGLIALLALPMLFVVVSRAWTQTVPIRTLAPIDAATKTPIKNIYSEVRQTPSGKMLVNDALSRRLLRFDQSLATFEVVRDSVGRLPNSYGPTRAALIRYGTDSSLFVDIESQAIVVVGPEGDFGRAMALPNPKDANAAAGSRSGIDARGRLVYMIQSTPATSSTSSTAATDSAVLVRADFDLRRVDTIARIKRAVPQKTSMTGFPDNPRIESVVNPLQSVDDWAVLSDGSVALVRGQDYHIDWIRPNGLLESSAKMPFDWRRVTDVEKQKMLDSARQSQNRKDSLAATSTKPGAKTQSIIVGMNGRNVEVPATVITTFVSLKEVLDYYPPIRVNASRADLDNNLWILPTTSLASQNGELVYDVVNAKGELKERVRFPAGRSLVGFGKGGVVFLRWQDASGGWLVERTHVIR